MGLEASYAQRLSPCDVGSGILGLGDEEAPAQELRTV